LSFFGLAHSNKALGLKRGSVSFNFFKRCHTTFTNIRVTS
jgi:hypothetical protein